jgi:hypothetical protein
MMRGLNLGNDKLFLLLPDFQLPTQIHEKIHRRLWIKQYFD